MNKERTRLAIPEDSIKRYAVFSVPPVIEECRNGYFVNYEDYEVLKKKVDALESSREDLLAQLNFSTGGDLYDEIQRLKKDIERLHKAGDAMQDRLGCKCGWLLCRECQSAEYIWESSKGDKPSV